MLWAFASVATFFLSLWFLRFFGILGGEVDILVNWLSIVAFILFGVFIGIAISEKKVSVRGAIVNMLLTIILIPLSPLIGVTIALALPLSKQHMPIAAGAFAGGFGLLYIGLIYWLRKKGFLKFTEIDWT